MTIDGTTVDGNTASGADANQGGGGVFNAGGTLTVMNATITNNIADGAAGSGGGILNDEGSLTVMDTELNGNSSMRAGGAIEDNSVAGNMLTLTNVDMMGNSTASAPGNGGGLHITGEGDSMITGGTASGNTASAEGGAYWNGTGEMTIDGTTIDGNTASGADADQGGGGIFNAGGTVIVNNAIINNNIADGAAGSGGGILNDEGSLTVMDTELNGNSSMRAGGAIEDNSVAGNILTLSGVDFTGNSTGAAPGNGGAVHITGEGDSTITQGTASGNTAASEGGAFWNGTGEMIIDDVIIDGNIAEGADADNGGGGVFNNGGTLFITNGTAITNNQATGASGSGGGLLSTAGDVTVQDASFESNAANRAGGAIEIIDGTLGFSISTMIGNDVNGTAGTAAPGNGGGLHVTGNSGTIIIEDSTISGNEAAREGGGLWNQSGTTMTVTQTTLDGNSSFGTAEDDGGGAIFNNGGILEVMSSTLSNNAAAGATSAGGGIHNADGGDVILMVSTVTGNTSNGVGGGVYDNGASFEINAATIATNVALMGGGIASDANTTITNTIVALNDGGGNGEDISGNVTSNGYNLIGTDDLDVFAEDATDIEEVDPMVGPLQDNGGETFTHALMEGSPAYNAGNPDDMFDDQIQQPVFDNIRDIGAFEAQEVLLSIENVSSTGIDVVLYPNPSKGVATVEIPEAFGTDIEVQIFEIASGKLVRNVNLSPGASELNFTDMANGAYILTIQSETSNATKRLILAR